MAQTHDRRDPVVRSNRPQPASGAPRRRTGGGFPVGILTGLMALAVVVAVGVALLVAQPWDSEDTVNTPGRPGVAEEQHQGGEDTNSTFPDSEDGDARRPHQPVE